MTRRSMQAARSGGIVGVAMAGLVACGLVAIASAALAAPTGPAGDLGPVGYWALEVTLPDQTIATRIRFTDDHRFCQLTDRSRATGTWARTGPTTFRFEGREVLDDGQYLDATQDATLDEIRVDVHGPAATHFSSTGSAVLYNADGTVLGETASSVEGRRIEPFVC